MYKVKLLISAANSTSIFKLRMLKERSQQSSALAYSSPTLHLAYPVSCPRSFATSLVTSTKKSKPWNRPSKKWNVARTAVETLQSIAWWETHPPTTTLLTNASTKVTMMRKSMKSRKKKRKALEVALEPLSVEFIRILFLPKVRCNSAKSARRKRRTRRRRSRTPINSWSLLTAISKWLASMEEMLTCKKPALVLSMTESALSLDTSPRTLLYLYLESSPNPVLDSLPL